MPDTITPERLAELRKLAEAATPGPWRLDKVGDFHEPSWMIPGVLRERYGDNPLNVGEDQATGRHIAAFDPPTALALLDEIETLRPERDRLASRERFFASELKVADGGRYQNDWPARISAVVSERDLAQARIDDAMMLHQPVRSYTEDCDDLECEREHVEVSVGEYRHVDTFELVCPTCSGDLDCVDADQHSVPSPCPTALALDPSLGGER